jgi:Do/DeqQ family serine protease
MSNTSPKGRLFVLYFVAGLFAIGALLSVRLVHWAGHGVMGAEKIPVKVNKDPAPVSLSDFKNGFASVIDPALGAVVNISSTKVVKRQNQLPGFFFNDPFFRQFFGDQNPQSPESQGPQTQREQSLGSGVIVNPNGYLLTNNHVIEGASDVRVFTPDRKEYKAKVIGTDARTDVAVLKIEASGLPSFTLGDSTNLKVGDVVFAIGDPFGIGETATMGIVSATGRALGGAIERYEDFIQTDAAINPGNSGGALIDLHGNLIGINTAILSGGGGNQGVGFAIPINMARNIMEQILEHGKVVRGQLGVVVQPVDPDMAKALGRSSGGGALVADVAPNGPAAKAGIERGDLILEFNGQEIQGPQDLSVRASQTSPGTTVHLKVFRNGQTRDVAVTLSELSEKSPSAQGGQESGGGGVLRGLKVDTLTPSIARELQLPAGTNGVVVTTVDSSSPAAAADIQRGDVIQEVNRKPVRNMEDYQRAVQSVGDQSVLLLINRGGQTHFVVVQPQ